MINNKLTILTYHDDNYKNLGSLTSKNLSKYCEKYNFSLVVRNESYLKQGRPSAWAKINAIKEEFNKNQEWILWIDSDAVITNFEIDISKEIDNNFDMILSTDGYYAKLWHYWPSTAVFFIKKTNKTVELLEKIWDQPEEIINHCWWEQMGLLKTINENPHLRTCYKVVDYKKIFSQEEHWQRNDFIMHLAGGLSGKDEKYIKMKKFINKNNILI